MIHNKELNHKKTLPFLLKNTIIIFSTKLATSPFHGKRDFLFLIQSRTCRESGGGGILRFF